MNTKVAKKNNNGFTLIELIVVIAIIAVLAAILAPQYLRYVEKSRESADVQAAVEIINASKTAAAEEKVYNQIAQNTQTVVWTPATSKGGTDAKLTTTVSVNGVSDSTSEDDDPLGYELNQTIDLRDYKSKKYRDDPLSFTLTADNSKIKIVINSKDATTWTKNESLNKYVAS